MSEIHLAKNIKYDYTYDSLSRITKRTLTNLSDNTTSEEVYAYDNAGNITSCTVSNGANTFVYDQNNRLISYNGQAVTYDMDGNMLSATLNGAQMSFVYDSANRLISAGQNSYTYNVEDVRVRNLCGESETTYAYNTNGRLSQLLAKTTDGVITKYVYGIGLIGEETSGSFKTYHFDYRGSTAAITDINGNVTDTFEYDTYGNLISRTGTSVVIFLYNGRDGVVTDSNGLIYMRARYYSPDLKRFINADIIAGEISNAVTLNRYAYANGNPVSNIDPFGLSAERGNKSSKTDYTISPFDLVQNFASAVDGFELIIGKVKFVKDGKYINIKGDRAILDKFNIKQTRIKADNIKNFKGIADLANASSAVASALKSKSNWALSGITIAIETTYDISQYDDWDDKLIVGSYDIVSGVIGTGLSLAGGAWAGAKIGSAFSPGWGTLGGILVGGLIGWGYDLLIDEPIKGIIVINLVEA